MKELLDKKTLDAFTEGKSSGFNAIFNLYYGQICYFCERLTGNANEGEDIAIQTFTTLFRMHKQFNTLPNIKAFLYITARNNCFNYLRSLQRRRSHEKQFGEQIKEKAAENEILETLIVKEIHDAVEQLPTECKRVFKLIYFYGMKTSEVAKELSIAQSTVRNHKKNALELLRISLSNNELTIGWLIIILKILFLH